MATKAIKSPEVLEIKKVVKEKPAQLKEMTKEEPVQMLTDEIMKSWFPPADDKNYSSKTPYFSPVRRGGGTKMKVR